MEKVRGGARLGVVLHSYVGIRQQKGGFSPTWEPKFHVWIFQTLTQAMLRTDDGVIISIKLFGGSVRMREGTGLSAHDLSQEISSFHSSRSASAFGRGSMVVFGGAARGRRDVAASCVCGITDTDFETDSGIGRGTVRCGCGLERGPGFHAGGA